MELIPERDVRELAQVAVDAAVSLAPEASLQGLLHGDPAPGAFLADEQGDVGLIDWGAVLYGPPAYDVASAVMYASAAAIDGYGDIPVEVVEVFLRFRFAVQAWYFAQRIARHDLTGTDAGGNAKGYADGCDMLRSGIERSGRRWGRP
jgi:homoserine kinase type II